MVDNLHLCPLYLDSLPAIAAAMGLMETDVSHVVGLAFAKHVTQALKVALEGCKL